VLTTGDQGVGRKAPEGPETRKRRENQSKVSLDGWESAFSSFCFSYSARSLGRHGLAAVLLSRLALMIQSLFQFWSIVQMAE